MSVIRDLLIKHEGLRLKVYADTVGKASIGVGRNLVDKGITEAEAYLMLDNDIKEVSDKLFKTLPWASKLSENRQAVMLSMAFNMGMGGLLAFKNTLGLVESGDYPGAAKEMLQSKWAVQVGNRAIYLAKILETDSL